MLVAGVEVGNPPLATMTPPLSDSCPGYSADKTTHESAGVTIGCGACGAAMIWNGIAP